MQCLSLTAPAQSGHRLTSASSVFSPLGPVESSSQLGWSLLIFNRTSWWNWNYLILWLLLQKLKALYQIYFNGQLKIARLSRKNQWKRIAWSLGVLLLEFSWIWVQKSIRWDKMYYYLLKLSSDWDWDWGWEKEMGMERYPIPRRWQYNHLFIGDWHCRSSSIRLIY